MASCWYPKCRLPPLSVKKYGNNEQRFIYVRKSVRLTEPIFRKLTVAPRLFVKKQNSKFHANSRKNLLLIVGHRQTNVVSTYGAICNFANSAWKCHYVTGHRHQFSEIELTRQRIRIASLPRKLFHSINGSNQGTVFVRFCLPNLITEDS